MLHAAVVVTAIPLQSRCWQHPHCNQKPCKRFSNIQVMSGRCAGCAYRARNEVRVQKSTTTARCAKTNTQHAAAADQHPWTSIKQWWGSTLWCVCTSSSQSNLQQLLLIHIPDCPVTTWAACRSLDWPNAIDS